MTQQILRITLDIQSMFDAYIKTHPKLDGMKVIDVHVNKSIKDGSVKVSVDFAKVVDETQP